MLFSENFNIYYSVQNTKYYDTLDTDEKDKTL